MGLWRSYAGGVAWLSLAMGTLGPALFGLGLVAAGLGWVPAWAVAPVQLAIAYTIFIAMHDATHGSVGGGRRAAWLDELVGWLVAGVFLSAYPFFRWSHLQHHSHVNHPDKDPDRWVAGAALWRVVLRCISVIPGYYLRLARADRSRASVRQVQRQSLLGLLPVLALAGAYGAWAGWGTLLLVWVLPAIGASALLGYIFDYLPHRPHESQARFDSASFAPRTYRDSGLFYLLTLGQTHHPVHHLFPRVPWFRYRSLYLRISDELSARGVPNA